MDNSLMKLINLTKDKCSAAHAMETVGHAQMLKHSIKIIMALWSTKEEHPIKE